MRQIVIVTQPTFESVGIYLPGHFSPLPFHNAKVLLGQEFAFGIYVMGTATSVNFNLDALAILAGTIYDKGTLYIVCPQWHELEQQIDLDSLRWNNQQAITTPVFFRYFKQLVTQFGFRIQSQWHIPLYCHPAPIARFEHFTAEQQAILSQLPQAPEPIHLITAPRGRGKSTLVGQLAQRLAQQQNVIVTARTAKALPNFWRQITERKQSRISFFAPDHLLQAVQKGQNFAKTWLFIDESASLPLATLNHLCQVFDRVVLTTTTQNYEGTGRGFVLKFTHQLQRPYRHWQLTQPLRWEQNDPVERFINELLLLDDESAPSHNADHITFYRLLAMAHYKTTPTDLRRLFDSPDQHYYTAIVNNQLQAGIWGFDEGGFSTELAQAVWRGERRPYGHLVAQYLCFQNNLPQACQLRSVRISRIAVQPELQGQGIGKRSVNEFILQISEQKSPLAVDFISVSFGMSEPLLHFWQQCGFQLVSISQKPEASSGYLSAMMIYPLSEQGKTFCKQAVGQFERDRNVNDKQELDEQDWQNLFGFAYFQRTLASCRASLQRFLWQCGERVTFDQSLAPVFDPTLKWSKSELAQFKLALQPFLPKTEQFPPNSPHA